MPGRSVEVDGIHFWVQLPGGCAECRNANDCLLVVRRGTFPEVGSGFGAAMVVCVEKGGKGRKTISVSGLVNGDVFSSTMNFPECRDKIIEPKKAVRN